MGEKQPVDTESRKIKEINNFFEGLKKVDNGELLGFAFQHLTFDKTWKLRGNNVLLGKIKDEEDSPVIALRDLRGAEEVKLQVFRNEKHFNRSSGSGDLVFIAGRAKKSVIFDLKPKINPYMLYDISDKYNRLLIKVLAEVSLRFEKARLANKK